ncbi:DUF2975 domain-containing protein [Aeromicrobium phragmitis]|uniref:DUF2975 domain-containing protein n=1 Tax=Aeromicrobium phragmitis TaxID=2478914 RepID=A0A3L8PHJ9_9ACTN|nr:DUF2975 domain-containing protein [Aeromicrobium phragmitis]RLV54747.1 DUF2975 domain-containing protein [Aeromicrobium phragmitis]
MGTFVVYALRVVIGLLLAGSVFVQAVMVPLLRVDLDEAGGDLSAVQIPVVVIVILGFVAAQVVLVCVWRLLTMVRRGTVFSHGTFRYVDIIIGAVVAAAALIFALAVTLAQGEAVAPGVVLLICGLSVTAAGVALLVFVMRSLLVQAVAREVEAHDLRAELDEVI